VWHQRRWITRSTLRRSHPSRPLHQTRDVRRHHEANRPSRTRAASLQAGNGGAYRRER
jgi:hypothetical protein